MECPKCKSKNSDMYDFSVYKDGATGFYACEDCYCVFDVTYKVTKVEIIDNAMP